MPHLGVVYFARSGLSGPIKIGHTAKALKWRVNNMQSGNPETLYLLASMPGDRQFEQDLHQLFARHRLVREWFVPAPELLWLIEELAREENALRHPEPVEGLRARIYELGQAMLARMRRRAEEARLMARLSEADPQERSHANKSAHSKHARRRANSAQARVIQCDGVPAQT